MHQLHSWNGPGVRKTLSDVPHNKNILRTLKDANVQHPATQKWPRSSLRLSKHRMG
jgi:hypothetical protein